ncbi:hypothetical protein FSS13T_09530 [Flavobacterium saliperosum S13]|uniref:Mevalonate kinase n=2 Tax=Flavobacterium saliperosum TaxID=329186 RepID=A0A1G4VWD5_9FLAO|nr:GYDIA family GHMP kinase [Flavobacterium saliperosum]ESU26786.1 hypothetical protein FSS13T_09530 [Flavobacterium saliperosum S13]SCX12966.1 Mevalonate kinase [Flavobacterium saliperosum]
MKQIFYSNGKLLLTGEYVVLDGAKALALPTKFGQSLQASSGEKNTIFWKSQDSDGSVWFEEEIPFEAIKNKIHSDSENAVKNTLIDILHQAYKQNNRFLDHSEGYTVTTVLTFPRFWGLGTSSTLINNIAQWLQIDAFELLRKSFGGSGYDIACAQNDTPILYRLEKEVPQIETVSFRPPFADQLYFVYLNRKQSSRAAINAYYNKQQRIGKIIHEINGITNALLTADTISRFSELLENHEIIMSNVLEMQTVKEALFPDFKGVVKSLGAWGGDFVLIVSEEDPQPYFQERGYNTIISYPDMIK